MEFVMGGLSPAAFWAAVAIAAFAGFVKGTLGFAMPLVIMAGFTSFMPPEMAVAGLIMPTLTTNLSQAFRQGFAAAWASTVKFRRMIIAIVICIPISAQFIAIIPERAFLLLLGVPVTLFALAQLTGRNLKVNIRHRNRAETVTGIVGGLYGGVAGIWGPPVIVYLLSIGAEKIEMIRVQGVVFLIGVAVLLAAHLQTGVMNAQTIPFSAALALPAFAGLYLGYALQDRLPQPTFRRWTQIMLAITGINLVRVALGF